MLGSLTRGFLSHFPVKVKVNNLHMLYCPQLCSLPPLAACQVPPLVVFAGTHNCGPMIGYNLWFLTLVSSLSYNPMFPCWPWFLASQPLVGLMAYMLVSPCW